MGGIMEIAGLVAGILALIVSIVAYITASNTKARIDELEIHVDHEMETTFKDVVQSNKELIKTTKEMKEKSGSSGRKRRRREPN